MSDVIASQLDASDKDCWATPQWLFDALNREFSFQLDAAADDKNAKCEFYISKQQDALSVDNWESFSVDHFFEPLPVWINPPYSRGMIKAFLDKAYQQCAQHGATVVLLVPATPDAGWWPSNATEIRFITGGRISFEHPLTGKTTNGNTKGSALIIYRQLDLGSSCVTRYVDRDRLKASVTKPQSEVA